MYLAVLVSWVIRCLRKEAPALSYATVRGLLKPDYGVDLEAGK
jgi:hypothetical protein